MQAALSAVNGSRTTLLLVYAFFHTGASEGITMTFDYQPSTMILQHGAALAAWNDRHVFGSRCQGAPSAWCCSLGISAPISLIGCVCVVALDTAGGQLMHDSTWPCVPRQYLHGQYLVRRPIQALNLTRVHARQRV